MRFAQIDDDGVVVQVVVADSVDWVVENIGGTWVETFKDGTRYNFAGIGFTYDEARDAFIPPKPYPSWVLDEDTCLWVAPIPMPEEVDADGEPIAYRWDEEAGDWVAADE